MGSPPPYISDTPEVNDGIMTAYITDTDGKLATTSNETGGTKIFEILTRTTPLTITDDTNAIDIQFSVNQALQPEINGLDGNGVYTIAGFWEGLFFSHYY